MFAANSSVIYHMISVGYLQSFFGVYSIRIENVGVRKPPNDDVKITGVAHPHDFRKAVLVHLLNIRNLNFSRRAPSDEQQSTSLNPIASAWVCLQYSLTLKVVHCFNKVIELHIGMSNFQNTLYSYQLPLLNSIWFPKCL